MVMNAPPMAASEETKPIARPTSKVPSAPGNGRDGLGLRSIRMLVAAKKTTTVNVAANIRVEIQTVRLEPSKPPTRMPGVSASARSQRAAQCMGAHARYRGKQNARHAAADSQVHDLRLGQSLGFEQHHQQRHHD